MARPSLGPGPLAVVLAEDEDSETSGAALVGAVDDAAAELGVKVGERVSEAMARSSDLAFTQLSPRAIDEALALVAEVALGFGPVVEITSSDTIVIDITGADHLFAGEATMRDEIAMRVASLGPPGPGFRVDVAISDGPFLAQALARYAGIHPDLPRIAAPNEARKSLARLPVSALGLGPESIAFFGRLGVLSLGDLMRIDRAQLSARLTTFTGAGRPSLGEVLGWLDGVDARPLVPYEPPAIITEQMTFEDGVESAPQLVFAVRGLVARLSSRLVGRRQATNRVDVSIRYDRAILLLRSRAALTSADLSIDLPAPLSHTDDLFRAIKAKVENLELAAPAVAVEIRLSRIARAPEVQLDLSRDVSVSPDALPALLSELSAEIGVDQVGVLVTIDDHRPEKRSLLASPTSPLPTRERKKSLQLPLFDSTADHGPPEPPRLLPRPIPLGTNAEGGRRLSALRAGTTVFIGKVAFTIQHVRFDRRIDGVAWWTKGVVHRDYLRVALAEEPRPQRGSLFTNDTSPRGAAEAWVFVDRRTGETFLHGWWE